MSKRKNFLSADCVRAHKKARYEDGVEEDLIFIGSNGVVKVRRL